MMITVASPGPATLLKSISHKISVRAAEWDSGGWHSRMRNQDRPWKPSDREQDRSQRLQPSAHRTFMATNESVWSLPFVDYCLQRKHLDLGRWVLEGGHHDLPSRFCWRGSTGTGPVGSSVLVLGHIPICYWDLKCVGEVGR